MAGFSLTRGSSGEKTFRAATLSALFLLFIFFIGITASMAYYTDVGTFVKLLLSDEIQFAIRLSLITATAATIFSVVFALPAAYAISRMEFWGKDIIDTVLDLPIVISPIALGAALLVFFNTPIGKAVEDRGAIFVFTVPGIILAQFTVVSALAIRLMKSTFDGIGTRYEDVARTLGCSKWEAFYKVTLPLAKNGLIAATILTWARAVGEFGATVTLAGAMRMKTETLPVAIFLKLASADVEGAVAVIFILILISTFALFVIRKITGEGYSL